ncbi:Alpha carbonic anhydrase [Trinorchestia longiramus]|nr:Alpha carbonic anhydrase [Trinorchestia longiramus]
MRLKTLPVHGALLSVVCAALKLPSPAVCPPLLSALPCCSSASGAWSYSGSTGPSNWGHMVSSCNGRRQSPINIETANVKRENWKPVTFKNYDMKPRRMRIKNNGHAAQVEIDAAAAPRVDDGGLSGEYIFAQFHFHWGGDSSMGSEHTINGVRYPMEMHLVHYKTEYGSIQQAVQKSDGLAVLGVMFEISQTDNPAFTPLVNALREIEEPSMTIEVDAQYPLRAFLPRNLGAFYRYEGSLTTPTCNEVVTWTVFDQAVPISEAQMEVFRSLRYNSGNNLVNNFRPPQALANRRVFMSFSGTGSDASSLKSMGMSVYFLSTLAVVMVNM